MKAVVSNAILITDPTEEILAWCKEHLVLSNPEYVTRMRMNLYTGKTPKEISLYEKRGQSLILPFGALRDIMLILRKGDVTACFTEPEKIDYQSKVSLYEYQEQAVQTCLSKNYGILQSPAGSGKTQMGIALIERLGKRALWLTHTHDLLLQSKERAEQYIDKSLIGTITEGKVEIGAGITFATVQTMCRLDLSQYKNLWDVIICDECHKIGGSPTKVTQYYKVLNALAARHKYGLSATVHRGDGMIAATYALIGRVICTVPESAVGEKIMKVAIQTIPTGTPLSRECLNSDGILNYTGLVTYLCDDENRNCIIRDSIVAERGKSCLILSDRVKHLETLMNALPDELKKNAVIINGAMTSKKAKEQRDCAIAEMRNGSKKYLFATYGLAKEGLDIPRLERVFLTTPHKDYAVITQSIGRIARVCDGKAEPVALDFVDDILYCRKAYKERCRTYRKNGCVFI